MCIATFTGYTCHTTIIFVIKDENLLIQSLPETSNDTNDMSKIRLTTFCQKSSTFLQFESSDSVQTSPVCGYILLITKSN